MRSHFKHRLHGTANAKRTVHRPTRPVMENFEQRLLLAIDIYTDYPWDTIKGLVAGAGAGSTVYFHNTKSPNDNTRGVYAFPGTLDLHGFGTSPGPGVRYTGVAATYDTQTGAVIDPGTVITKPGAGEHWAFSLPEFLPPGQTRNNITIDNITFDGCGIAVLNGAADSLTVEHNLIRNAALDPSLEPDHWDGAGTIKTTYSVSNSSISNNVFKDNKIFAGIYCNGGVYRNVDINNNVFTNCVEGIQLTLRETNPNNEDIHIDGNKGIGLSRMLIEVQGGTNSQGSVDGLVISGNKASGFVNHTDSTFGISAPISGPNVLGMVVSNNEISDIPDQGVPDSDQTPGVRIGLEVGGRTGQSSGFGVTIEANKLYGMVTPIALTGGVKNPKVSSADKDIVFWRSSMVVNRYGVQESIVTGTPDYSQAADAYVDLPDTLPSNTNVAFDLWTSGTSGADAFEALESGTIRRGGVSVGSIPDTTEIDGLGPGRAVIGGQGGADAFEVHVVSVVLVSPQIATLDICDNGRVRVAGHHAANSAAGTVVLAPQSLFIEAGSVFDLDNNSLVLDYTTVGSLVQTIRGYLQDGRLTTTSTFRPGTRLGYVDNGALASPYATWGEISVDSSSLLLKYTYAGDADLDGDVDIADLGILTTNWQGNSRVWTQGDFDYNESVDVNDLGMLATNWQAGTGSEGPLFVSRDPGEEFLEGIEKLGLSGDEIAKLLEELGEGGGNPL